MKNGQDRAKIRSQFFSVQIQANSHFHELHKSWRTSHLSFFSSFSGNGNQCDGSGLAFAPEDWTREKVVLVVGKGLLKDDNIIDIAKKSAKVLITSDIVDVSSILPSNIIKVGEMKRLDFKLIRSSPDLSI